MKHDSVKHDDDLRQIFQSVRFEDQDEAFLKQLRARLLEQARAREAAALMRPERHRRILHVGRLVWAAAAVLVIGFACWWMFGGGTTVASADLAAVIAKVRAATSVSFRRTLLIPGRPAVRADVQIMTGKYRATLGDKITIRDDATGSELDLNTSEMRAVRSTGVTLGLDQGYLDRLRNIHAEAGRFVAQEEQAGQITNLYEVFHNDSIVRIWADVKNELPVRVEIRPLSKVDAGVVEIMDNFAWNHAIDSRLFRMDTPVGYVLREDEIALGEQEILEMLRVFATLSGGKFPDALDKTTAANLVTQDLDRRAPGSIAQIHENGTVYVHVDADDIAKDYYRACLRGLKLLERLEENGTWHYAGKGATLGDTSAPVLWWGLPGGNTVHVVYGDLRTGEMPAAEFRGRYPNAVGAIATKQENG